MANSYIKATKVVRTALGVLQREIVLPGLVWSDAAFDFTGAYNDTITIKVPAYMVARVRALRGGTPISIDELAETSVAVTLDRDVYRGVNITDEEMELDIADFGEQVINPIVASVARGLEDEIADTITGATYTLTETFSEADPLGSVLAGRTKLNLCEVPVAGRALLVGAQIEEIILKALANRESGAPSEQSALNDATIAYNFGGFRVVSSNAIAPDEAYAFHRTAFALAMRAPRKPDGCTWGTSMSYAGLAMRVIKDYDPLYVRDRCIGNCWIGCTPVTDDGDLNDDGQFMPEDGSGSGSPILVRAVKYTLGS